VWSYIHVVSRTDSCKNVVLRGCGRLQGVISYLMMMMMMRRFVKRVLNSPQRRCQSIKQVALEMSGERQRREHCSSKGSWQTVPDCYFFATRCSQMNAEAASDVDPEY